MSKTTTESIFVRIARDLYYERGELSQERAAERAGLIRLAFVEALGRYGVSPFRATAGELIREAMND